MAGCQELKARHREVMQELLMDVLRALGSPNMDIRKKTLDIALDLINARNIDEVRSKPWGCLHDLWGGEGGVGVLSDIHNISVLCIGPS